MLEESVGDSVVDVAGDSAPSDTSPPGAPQA